MNKHMRAVYMTSSTFGPPNTLSSQIFLILTFATVTTDNTFILYIYMYIYVSASLRNFKLQLAEPSYTFCVKLLPQLAFTLLRIECALPSDVLKSATC